MMTHTKTEIKLMERMCELNRTLGNIFLRSTLVIDAYRQQQLTDAQALQKLINLIEQEMTP
jgi:hypothetical protein